MATARLSAHRLDELARSAVRVPDYDRDRLRSRIVHVGLGAFARSHLAVYTDGAARHGGDWGITGLGLLGRDRLMAEALSRQDHLYTLTEKGPGAPRTSVVGSLVGCVHSPRQGDRAAIELLAAPATTIVSLTVTEAGYGEGVPAATFDRIALGLEARRARGSGPVTVLSCDNLQGNGAAARRAVVAAADRLDSNLASWVDQHCSFPNSMVDRITPVATAADRSRLEQTTGVLDEVPVVCEPFRQWVLEDDFVAGRPAWELDGAIFTGLVDDWERYKLRLLNAGHSSLAYLAALVGARYVHDAVALPGVHDYLEELLLVEALPTIVEVPGFTREAYVASVLERFRNPGIEDQIARLCLDGAAKFPIFLVPSIVHQLAESGPVDRAATALAGWARYLAVVPRADQANDALLEDARRHAATATSDPVSFLHFAAVFPAELREERFASAFARAYRTIAERGPVAAMVAATRREHAGVTR